MTFSERPKLDQLGLKREIPLICPGDELEIPWIGWGRAIFISPKQLQDYDQKISTR